MVRQRSKYLGEKAKGTAVIWTKTTAAIFPTMTEPERYAYPKGPEAV